MNAVSLRVAFLDRDGTINVDHGYVYRAADWRFTDRAPEAIALLQQAGFSVAVVTNQSGVAAGYYTLDDLQVLHDHMRRELALAGASVDAIAFCHHAAAEHCDCRKPQIGMARQIEAALGEKIDYRESWMIGDKLADFEFGRALGMHTVLLRSRYWSEADLTNRPEVIADSLFLAAGEIVRGIIQSE